MRCHVLLLLLLLLVSGCGQILGLEEASLEPGAGDDARDVDAAPPDAYVCNAPNVECVEGDDLVCTSLDDDPDHCGDCDTYCDRTGGTASCDSGTCGIACATDSGDCNLDVTDGCEVSLADTETSCGACSRDCLGGGCSEGACGAVDVVPMTDNPIQLVLDATHLYYVSRNTAGDHVAIKRVEKLGGTPTTIASVSWVAAMAVDDTHIYWVSDKLRRTPKEGGAAVQDLTTFYSGEVVQPHLLVDSTRVYFVTTQWGGSEMTYLRSVLKAGSAMAEESVIATSGQPDIHGLAQNDSYVFALWDTGSSSLAVRIRRMAKVGNEDADVGLSFSCVPRGFAATSTHLHCACTDKINRFHHLTGAMTYFDPGIFTVYGLGVVDDSLYLSGQQSGVRSIRKIDDAFTTSVQIPVSVSEAGGYHDVRFDESFVYWRNPDTWTIQRATL